MVIRAEEALIFLSKNIVPKILKSLIYVRKKHEGTPQWNLSYKIPTVKKMKMKDFMECSAGAALGILTGAALGVLSVAVIDKIFKLIRSRKEIKKKEA